MSENGRTDAMAMVLAALSTSQQARGEVGRILPEECLPEYVRDTYRALLSASTEQDVARAWMGMPTGLGEAVTRAMDELYLPAAISKAKWLRDHWRETAIREELEATRRDKGRVTPADLEAALEKYPDAPDGDDGPEGVEELAGRVLDLIDQRGGQWTRCGIESVDRRTWGMRPGDVWVVAGRPNHGKSQLAYYITHNLLRQDKRVLVFTLEMPAHQVMMRLLGIEAGVEIADVVTGHKGPEWEQQAISHFGRAVSEVSGHWDERLTILEGSQRYSSIAAAVARYEPDVWVVDQVGLVTADGDNRAQALSGLVYSLKGLAGDTGTTAVLVHQLSRSIEHRSKSVWRPLMSDLKDSGGVEEVADHILCIVREYLVSEDPSERSISTVYQVKNRLTGQVGMVTVAYESGGRFREMVAKGHEDEPF